MAPLVAADSCGADTGDVNLRLSPSRFRPQPRNTVAPCSAVAVRRGKRPVRLIHELGPCEGIAWDGPELFGVRRSSYCRLLPDFARVAGPPFRSAWRNHRLAAGGGALLIERESEDGWNHDDAIAGDQVMTPFREVVLLVHCGDRWVEKVV